ncbi:MAG TPA: phage holin family protein [Gemmataceae bacterium]|nr:phage holin family protein [Gemmataceae bacterium]
MNDRIPTESPPSMAALLGGIVNDLQALIRQEIALAKSEMVREWDKAKTAASSLAVGAALLALGGVLLCFAVVYVLHEVAGLPLWASFLIVGGVITGLGAVLFFIGRAKAGQVNVIPPQTAETMKENVQWIRNQT